MRTYSLSNLKMKGFFYMPDFVSNQSTFLQQQLDEWIKEYKKYTEQGATADYIPALKKANQHHLGICMLSSAGTCLKSGDSEHRFTLQSISKVLSFIYACKEKGIPFVLEYVDVEPTGDAFNSIFRLELSHPGRPFNPMINAGAITVASLLPGKSPSQKIDSVLEFIGNMTGRKPELNEEVFCSEWKTAYRNRSLAYWLKETGYLLCEVEEAMEAYLKLCSIELTVFELAKIGLILAEDGIHPSSGEQLFSSEIASLTKTLMFTCGMYDYSGRFAAFVGIPAKSGVSGGILAAIPPSTRISDKQPHSWGIGLYGPAIDKHGNSIAGLHLLQRLSREWNLRII